MLGSTASLICPWPGPRNSDQHTVGEEVVAAGAPLGLHQHRAGIIQRAQPAGAQLSAGNGHRGDQASADRRGDQAPRYSGGPLINMNSESSDQHGRVVVRQCQQDSAPYPELTGKPGQALIKDGRCVRPSGCRRSINSTTWPRGLEVANVRPAAAEGRHQGKRCRRPVGEDRKVHADADEVRGGRAQPGHRQGRDQVMRGASCAGGWSARTTSRVRRRRAGARCSCWLPVGGSSYWVPNGCRAIAGRPGDPPGPRLSQRFSAEHHDELAEFDDPPSAIGGLQKLRGMSPRTR